MKNCARLTNGKCSSAVNPQPLENFAKDKKRADGLTAWCKSCLKTYRDENKEQRHKTIMAWRKRNPHKWKEHYEKYKDKYLERTRKWNESHPGYFLEKRYGMNQQNWNDLFEKQNGCCAICKVHNSKLPRLVVDHCHNSKKVRGLLCDRCNKSIGAFEDSIDLLQNAIDYLTQYK